MSSRLPSGSTSRLSSELIPAALVVLLVVAAGTQFALPSAAALPEKPHKKVAAQQEDEDGNASEQPRPLPVAYNAIMAHPIFAPDRAPPPAEAEEAGNLSGVEVLGTAIAGNDAAAALVRDTDGSFRRVKMGEEIAGWKLVAIEPKALVFDRNGERRTLDLDATRLKSQSAGGASGLTKPQFGATGAIPNTPAATTDDDDSDDDDQ